MKVINENPYSDINKLRNFPKLVFQIIFCRRQKTNFFFTDFFIAWKNHFLSVCVM